MSAWKERKRKRKREKKCMCRAIGVRGPLRGEKQDKEKAEEEEGEKCICENNRSK